MLTETEKAYIAGIVDGEGCLQAHIYDRKLVMRLEVGNTVRDLPEWLQERLGGTITSRQRRGRRRAFYLWRAETQRAAYVLRQVLPYLHIKREQAETFIELAEMRAAQGRGHRLLEPEFSRRVALVDDIAQQKRLAV